MVLAEDETRVSDHLSLGDVLEWSDAREVKPRPRRGRRPRLPRLEPMVWGLFSAGGFAAALLVPVHVAILGIAYAAGWLPKDALSYERVLHLARNPVTKLYLLGVVALPLFHWAHRFRYAVHHQFGLHGGKRVVAAACYGTAVAGTLLAVLVIIRI
jgi:fumarate reductase subunit D